MAYLVSVADSDKEFWYSIGKGASPCQIFIRESLNSVIKFELFVTHVFAKLELKSVLAYWFWLFLGNTLVLLTF